jgi:ribonuclease E
MLLLMQQGVMQQAAAGFGQMPTFPTMPGAAVPPQMLPGGQPVAMPGVIALPAVTPVTPIIDPVTKLPVRSFAPGATAAPPRGPVVLPAAGGAAVSAPAASAAALAPPLPAAAAAAASAAPVSAPPPPAPSVSGDASANLKTIETTSEAALGMKEAMMRHLAAKRAASGEPAPAAAAPAPAPPAAAVNAPAPAPAIVAPAPVAAAPAPTPAPAPATAAPSQSLLFSLDARTLTRLETPVALTAADIERRARLEKLRKNKTTYNIRELEQMFTPELKRAAEDMRKRGAVPAGMAPYKLISTGA